MAEPNERVQVERGGARSELRSFTCKAPRAVVVVVPAMGVAAKFYDRLGEALAVRNLATFVSELRGIGSSNVRASRKEDFGYLDLVDDLGEAVRQVRARSGELPIFVLGHSLGGHLGVVFAGLHEAAISGLIVVAAGTPHFRNWAMPRRGLLLLGSFVMPAAGALLGYVPGDRLGFGGREASRLIREWARFVRTGELAIDGVASIEMKRALDAATLPVLGLSLEEDDFAPRISMDKLLAVLPNAKLTRMHLERGAVAPNMDHFRWAKSPAVVVDAVEKWITTIAKTSSVSR